MQDRSVDPRYFDLGPMIREAGIDWDHLHIFLRLTSLHPFSHTFSGQVLIHKEDIAINELIKSYGCDLVIYNFKMMDQEGLESPLRLSFYVHVGAVEFFCEYLGLKKIPTYEAVTQIMTAKEEKIFILPHLKKTDKEIEQMLERLKDLYSNVSKRSPKKMSDRCKMFACLIDTDQEITRKYLA